MAITQRTWRISNPLTISVLATVIFLFSGCVSASPIDVENAELSVTATSESKIVEIDNQEETQEKNQPELETISPTQVVKNNLGMVPSVKEEINENLFVPMLGFPISEENNRVIEPSYRFGSTLFGERMLHDGVELLNPLGTPVLAAADGTVYFSGNDQSKKWGRYTNLYGNFIILEHRVPDHAGPIYTLYAHLSELLVENGQQITKGQTIGKVGATGKAFTNHLHFEVRVGDMLLQNARNPELFLPLIESIEGSGGILIGSLLSRNGDPIPGESIVIQRMVEEVLQTGSTIYVETYAKGIAGDGLWQENFVISNLSVGDYRISAFAYGNLIEEFITINENEVTLIKLQPEE
jgi:murein DD-endopeptidase MepM/ murein hydrolase activator NlpD